MAPSCFGFFYNLKVASPMINRSDATMKYNNNKTSGRNKRCCLCRFFSIKDICVFLIGSALTASLLLNHQFIQVQQQHDGSAPVTTNDIPTNHHATTSSSSSPSPLSGIKVLVAVVAYDFSQVPHLEEVLDGYMDLCAAGSLVDVVVYATVAWPVSFIDILNTRFHSSRFSITVRLLSPRTRLHLVDFHRELFYEKLEDYSLFIYTEDDIRVSPRTVAAYLVETNKISQTLGPLEAANYNVGIVRYEYNFPSNMIIDDGNRKATENVTRVYWEHSWHPPVPKSVDIIPQHDKLPGYVHMSNHHQGMYLATQDLLRAWKDKAGCEFNLIKNRPHVKDKPGQPSEGTQRVWMSSQQLYGKSHCNVQQVIPMDNFGAHTVLHLPNKNYRRVGRKGRLGGTLADKDKEAETALMMQASLPVVSSKLLTAMQLHIALRQKWPATPQYPYQGIQMLNMVAGGGSNSPLLIRRMKEYQEYVKRGGVMSDEDMIKLSLIE